MLSVAEPEGIIIADTLLFVDVDGVLNVGIKDAPNPCIEMQPGNVERAKNIKEKLGSRRRSALVERILAVAEREIVNDEVCTYAVMASDPQTGLCDELVKRLASILQELGDRCLVILSSSWRLPKNARRRKALEDCIAKHLCEEFWFDDATSSIEQLRPESRLENIGNYVSWFCARNPSVGALRAVILDDFFCNPMNGWNCGGSVINSPADAAYYIEQLSTIDVNVSAVVVHTYEAFTTDGGLEVEIGTGLTREKLSDIGQFLRNSDRGNPSSGSDESS